MTTSSLCLRPATAEDADGLWALLADADDTSGMGSLPTSASATTALCEQSSATIAALATGSYQAANRTQHRVLFVAVDDTKRIVGLTGCTFKTEIPNLGVRVETSRDGLGLAVSSASQPWTRTELDSSYLRQSARGLGHGTALSRGRMMLLHLVAPQVPNTIVSHLRGTFADDGNAPFWAHFGWHFAPDWATSTIAEATLREDPTQLKRLAGQAVPLTAEILDSLGRVNDASLPAFQTLINEGLTPTELFDPVDGGPTVRTELANTRSYQLRSHGRAQIGEGTTDALICTVAIDAFKVTRGNADLTTDGHITLTELTASRLEVSVGDLIAAFPIETTL